MNTNIKATGIELTPAIKEYAEKKLEVVEKYFDPSHAPHVAIEVGKSTAHHRKGDVFRAEVRIMGAGNDFYAVSEKDDLYAAIDTVKDEIIHEITHAKGKRSSMLRRGGRAVKDMMKGFFNR